MSSMPEPLHPVARGLAAPAGSLASYPPVERWDDWVDLRRGGLAEEGRAALLALIPTICFNCEAACGLLAYVDKSTGRIEKFEGNPVIPAAAGGTAPRARRRSTRSTTRSASAIRCGEGARAAAASGSG